MSDVAKYDLVIQRGATFRRIFIWQTSAGVPQSLEGYKARSQIRNSVGGDVLVELTTENGRITLEPSGDTTTGEVHLYIGATVTADLVESGVWDLELYNPTDPDEVVRLVEGRVDISSQVTVVTGE